MSHAVICDKCKKVMYMDSRSGEDAYAELKIGYWNDFSMMHLCKICYRQLLTEFIRSWKPEEFDETYGEI